MRMWAIEGTRETVTLLHYTTVLFTIDAFLTLQKSLRHSNSGLLLLKGPPDNAKVSNSRFRSKCAKRLGPHIADSCRAGSKQL